MQTLSLIEDRFGSKIAEIWRHICVAGTYLGSVRRASQKLASGIWNLVHLGSNAPEWVPALMPETHFLVDL